METTERKSITVEATILAPVEKVWKLWSQPVHICQWNNASDDWHTPKAENDLRVGGRFLSRMEAKDGSFGFDFEGTYDQVVKHELISYHLDDNRKVTIRFNGNGNTTTVTESFDADTSHSAEMQQAGWQAILNNFKKYAESVKENEKLRFEILIDAPVEKVYSRMLDEKQYQEWTAAFSPTSRFKGSWEKGSKILFLGDDEKGNTGGMVSRIKENIPNQFVSIEHLGLVKDGKEVISGEEVESWAGSLENYTFEQKKEKTLLSVEMDSNEEFESYFSETWPKALQRLKEICEA